VLRHGVGLGSGGRAAFLLSERLGGYVGGEGELEFSYPMDCCRVGVLTPALL